MNPLLLLLLIPITFVIWGLRYILRDVDATYARIDEFRARAEAATTVEQLNVIAADLCAWANKEIWHKTPGAAAHSVLTYIQGKRAGLAR